MKSSSGNEIILREWNFRQGMLLCYTSTTCESMCARWKKCLSIARRESNLIAQKINGFVVHQAKDFKFGGTSLQFTAKVQRIVTGLYLCVDWNYTGCRTPINNRSYLFQGHLGKISERINQNQYRQSSTSFPGLFPKALETSLGNIILIRVRL